MSRSVRAGRGAGGDGAPPARGGSSVADAWTAAEVVFAVAVAADHAQRPAFAVGRDHGVHPIHLAGAAEVFDRIPGAIRPCHVQTFARILPSVSAARCNGRLLM